MPTFVEFWKCYPRRVAKKYAEKCWGRLKLTDEGALAIIASVETHKRTEWKGRTMDKIPHASTFLNQARFEDELPRIAASPSDPAEGLHICRFCPGGDHEWEHDGDCWATYELACPEFRKALRIQLPHK